MRVKPLLAAVVLMLVTACGQSASATHVVSKPAPKVEAIQVHGAWTIDVRNADGTLASHTAFENALISSGGSTIAQMLGRQISPGLWWIAIGNDDALPIPCAHTGISDACFILENASSTPVGGIYSKGLTVTVPSSGANADSVVLSAVLLASQDGSIHFVTTFLGRCTVNVTGCDVSPYAMTSRLLASAIAVTTGQQVAITVVISFS